MTAIRTSPKRAGAGSGNGFIVVAVLWIMGALATLASIYAMYVANTATSLALNDDRLQAEAVIRAGLELTAYRLAAVQPDARPTRGAFNVRLGRASVAVNFRSESARIDLNEAPAELLAGFFAALGASPGDAKTYSERVLGWRSTPTPTVAGGEASLYRAMGLAYLPRGARFAQIEELRLVAGLPPALIERAMPFVTVFSGRADVSVADAAPEVIAALPGMTPERLYSALQQRGAQAGPLATAAPRAEAAGAAANGAFRVAVAVSFDNGRRINAEVVIFIAEDGDEPFNILSWQDDFDQTAADTRLRTIR